MLWLTLAVNALGLGTLVWLASRGWPGRPVDCKDMVCYCEVSGSTWWRQPVNTWSNLVPIGLSLGVAFEASRLEASSPVRSVLRVAFPLMLAFQGLGSMCFHASLTAWGAAVDAMSMFTITGLLLTVNLVRLGTIGAVGLLGWWGALIGLGLVFGLVAPKAVSPLMLVLFLSVMASEVVAAAKGKTRSARWFRGGITLFVVGVVVWCCSAIDGMPLCWPHSPFQGHALWHTTSGLAVAAFWRHALVNLSPEA